MAFSRPGFFPLVVAHFLPLSPDVILSHRSDLIGI